MSSISLAESLVEDVTLSWLADLGYSVRHGQEIAPGMPAAEREGFGEVPLPRLASGEIRVGNDPGTAVLG